MLLLTLFACAPLTGDWSGTIDCLSHEMPVSLALAANGDRYSGTGELDCLEYYGSECGETFDIFVVPSDWGGSQHIAAHLDNCVVTTAASSGAADCVDPDGWRWDGADTIEGDWGDCDASIERE